jgi:hypothetical protein
MDPALTQDRPEAATAGLGAARAAFAVGLL